MRPFANLVQRPADWIYIYEGPADLLATCKACPWCPFDTKKSSRVQTESMTHVTCTCLTCSISIDLTGQIQVTSHVIFHS